ncbi:GNAT family N-acetyltransferase [Longispora sp. K20-0274]|uniref:GNAT family N-acetyltransferase n=1 Tax=Longispora sp. K20-0274 TaxID=3088255 RepID=UPI00399A2FD7
MPRPELPAGYVARPATLADVPEIWRLVAACEDGHPASDPDTVAANLARPGMDLALDTVLVHDGAGDLVARAWVNRRSEVDVHPDHRGRGLGGALLTWTEARAREAGGRNLVQVASDTDGAAVGLLRAHGFEPFATNWLLEIAMPTEPEVPEPPAGVTVRAFRSGDGPAVHRLLEDAFDEWQERRRSYDEWARLTVERATFAPELSPVAFAGDEPVGVALALDVPGSADGYIERLAVRRDHRGLGIARLLLRHTFRDFHRRGRRTCTLWTHTNTGALSLYQRVGMTVRLSSTVYGLDL